MAETRGNYQWVRAMTSRRRFAARLFFAGRIAGSAGMTDAMLPAPMSGQWPAAASKIEKSRNGLALFVG
ncbi:hypothetical protein AM571_CH03912 [Rhizobium etli 8C-3]|uniref:Uncharacterized protein n=2 Tax=Rhizobium TaxID=379 RepID=A0A1L5P9E0_RHIET|nr:hypothetical protein AM571_CH03912 [Rhizobium etli 8C-3]